MNKTEDSTSPEPAKKSHASKSITVLSIIVIAFCVGLVLYLEMPDSLPILGIIITFIFLVWAISRTVSTAKNRQADDHNTRFERTFKTLKEIDDYYIPDSMHGLKPAFSIGFDNKGKKICFFDEFDISYIFDYSQILECELVVDGETMLKQSTASTIGRAALGGILTGGIGAVIGGVTGAKRQKENIKSIDLKIIINDTTNPIFIVNFYTGMTKKGSFIYKTYYAQAEKWHAIVSGLIRHGSKDTSITGSGSIADELKKLKGLLDDGAITKTEYEKQKQKVLA